MKRIFCDDEARFTQLYSGIDDINFRLFGIKMIFLKLNYEEHDEKSLIVNVKMILYRKMF